MKQNHEINFADERVRDFDVLTAQGSRLGRSEVINMDVPPRDEVIELMNHHADDVARIKSLREDFERLQDELDELILGDVYELDGEEEEVVEEFLEVW